MIARPHFQATRTGSAVRRVPGIRVRLWSVVASARAAVASLASKREAEPTRFSLDAWNAWSEHGTL